MVLLTRRALAVLMLGSMLVAAAFVDAPIAAAAPTVAPAPRSIALGFEAEQRPVVCGSRNAPCIRTSVSDLRVIVDATTPDLAGNPSTARIERWWRAPGAVRVAPAGSFEQRLDSAGGASLAASSPRLVGARPGTTCLRALLAASSSQPAAASPVRCVRLRPPVSIGWAGDITLGSSYGMPAGDGRHVFDAVRRQLRAPDIMIGNYEGTLSRGGRARCSGGAQCFIFQAPPRMAGGLRWAGFDVMNVANNHALDMGADARRQTLRALRSHDVQVVGMPEQVTIRRVADTTVALVGFGFNRGMMRVDDVATVRRVVRRASAAADVVVVVSHTGKEGTSAQHVPYGPDADRGNTRRFVATAIAAGADVVFSSGPHVVRGIEQRDRRLAFYSTGNFAGWRNFASGGALSNSGIVDVTLDHRGELAADARWFGVRLAGPGIPMPDTSGSVVRLVRSLSRADFGRRAPLIRRDGTITLRD